MDTWDRQGRVAAARVEFLHGESPDTTGVPHLVAASWRRSRSAGVDVNRLSVDYSDDFDTASRLVRCARPVIDRLHEQVTELPLVIALTDNHARIVSRLDTSEQVRPIFDRINLAPGFGYAEESLGTNGVGSALESGQSISVVGAEHLHERLQMFACTGAPVVDPVSGRVEGVLDISSLSQHWSPLMHSLVRAAAHDIGRNLLVDRSQSQQALFETYVRTDARTRHAVFAFGGSVQMLNAQAQLSFTLAEQQSVRDHAGFIFRGRDRASDTLTLDTGKTTRIHGTRIVVGADVAGIVVVAELVDVEHVPELPIIADRVLPAPAALGDSTRSIASGLALSQGQAREGRSVGWRRAVESARLAMKQDRSLVVTGETGTGKFTLALELFHEVCPEGRSLSFDASSFDQHGYTDTDLDALLSGDSTLCVFRNIDELSTAGAQSMEQLLRRLVATDRCVYLVATLSSASTSEELPFRQVLAYFDHAVTLPPIRFRSEDMPTMVHRLLRDLAPERDTRADAAAMALITKYTWPRNLVQLREALSHALSQRPAGVLTAEDLPPYCYTRSLRQLSHLEQTERDAIINALQAYDGNRVKAAEHLGMSRSSLYRKLSRYAITAI